MSTALTDEDKAFIRAILDHPEELTTWLVYADWLEERGDPRAEFLRLSVERRRLPADAPEAEGIDKRLTGLRETLDPNWMLVFDTARLANCAGGRWRFVCPLTWDQLAPTDVPDIRICHDCKSPVFFCHTVEEARQFASCGQCVALSTRVPDEENPFLEREQFVTGMLDSDEYPIPPPDDPLSEVSAEAGTDLGELPDLSGVSQPQEPPQRQPRPWWKFW
jgi:uncharacterized protein (TIGR02996 family)